MIKAYVKNGRITLVSGGKTCTDFTAGDALSTVGESGDSSPYALFGDFHPVSFPRLVQSVLDRLYAAGNRPPMALLALLADSSAQPHAGRTLKFALETADSEAVFVFFLDSAGDLLALEAITAIKSGKPLKKCENCGGYFFPAGRSDSVYCSRAGAGGRTCKETGAHRQYRRNSRSVAVKMLYDRVTKHNRYLKNKGRLQEAVYERWMAEAGRMYAQFKEGLVTERELADWLENGMDAPSQRPVRRNEISDYLL